MTEVTTCDSVRTLHSERLVIHFCVGQSFLTGNTTIVTSLGEKMANGINDLQHIHRGKKYSGNIQSHISLSKNHSGLTVEIRTQLWSRKRVAYITEQLIGFSLQTDKSEISNKLHLLVAGKSVVPSNKFFSWKNSRKIFPRNSHGAVSLCSVTLGKQMQRR